MKRYVMILVFGISLTAAQESFGVTICQANYASQSGRSAANVGTTVTGNRWAVNYRTGKYYYTPLPKLSANSNVQNTAKLHAAHMFISHVSQSLGTYSGLCR